MLHRGFFHFFHFFDFPSTQGGLKLIKNIKPALSLKRINEYTWRLTAIQTALANDRLLVGTVDTWLIWNLTSRKSHVTDVTNASRTMLMNLKTLKWDDELCDFFKINKSILPEVNSSKINTSYEI